MGSNAIRLAIAEYQGSGEYTVIRKVRTSLRVGRDVFSLGHISHQTQNRLMRVFSHYQDILDRYSNVKVKAVATSAFREASNGKSVARELTRSSRIPLQIISGREEAHLIQDVLKELPQVRSACVLLMDIGGGSIELTGLNRGRNGLSASLPLGTVRVLQMLKREGIKSSGLPDFLSQLAHPIEDFLLQARRRWTFDYCVGTGGNFESIYQLKRKVLKKKNGGFLRAKELKAVIETLSALSVRERIRRLKLKRDRADVIMPASLLARDVLKWSETSAFYVPRIGLKDGILLELSRHRD